LLKERVLFDEYLDSALADFDNGVDVALAPIPARLSADAAPLMDEEDMISLEGVRRLE
jgi:hypothetical protein